MYAFIERTDIRLTGSDRASFLHNFCTADIKSMQTGDIREAFILNVKGKLLGHVIVFCGDESLDINTVPGQSESLMGHLDKYLIREDVEVEQKVESHAFIFGNSPALPFTPETNQFHVSDHVRIANCQLAGPGYLVSAPGKAAIEAIISQADETEATPDQLELHRIKSGTPWFGIDSDQNTLPQELQRDELAISFEKGCYLGQETVARIDAIGRVNRLLVRIESNHELQAGNSIEFGEKVIGSVSSAQADGDKFVALATVRREHAASGTELSIANHTAQVV